MLNFIEMCEEYGTSFVCPSINFDTSTPVGSMVLHILSAFAEFQRKMIAENVKSNMDNLVETKDRYLTLPPFGYRLNKNTGKLEIVEEEAYWIRKMAEKFLDGEGYRKIARWLNENEVKTKRNNPWSATAVKTILKNDIYTGVTTWNRRYYNKKGKIKYRDKSKWIVKENTHQRILAPKTHEKIIDLIEKNESINRQKSNNTNQKQGQRENPSHKLSGLLYCSYCGSKLTSRKYSSKGPKKDKKIFVCSNYQKKGNCSFNYIFVSEAESIVFEITLKLITKELQKKIQELKESLDSKTNLDNLEINKTLTQAYNKQVKTIEEKFQRSIKAYENGAIDIDDLKKAKIRLEKEIQQIERKYLTSTKIFHRIFTELFHYIEVKEGKITVCKLNPDNITL